MANTPWDLIADHQNRNVNINGDLTAQNQGGNPNAPFTLTYGDFMTLMRATRRQSRFLSMPFTVGTSPLLLRDVEDRTYFILLNTSAAASIFIGFDFQPSSTNGVVLTAGGAYEPYQVPTNSIWVQGSVAGATGTLIYSVGN